MVTCYLRYILNPARLKEFEHYGRLYPPRVFHALGMSEQYCARPVQLPKPGRL